MPQHQQAQGDIYHHRHYYLIQPNMAGLHLQTMKEFIICLACITGAAGLGGLIYGCYLASQAEPDDDILSDKKPDISCIKFGKEDSQNG